MKIHIIYSSITGNTQKIAESIKSVFPEHTLIYPVCEAPCPAEADLLLLGFWVRRAGPDPLMTCYMQGVRHKMVAFFGTLGAYPDSPHAQMVKDNATRLLEGNSILGSFLCQGKIHASLTEAMAHGGKIRKTHPATPERIARHQEAAKHPNEEDFKKAQRYFLDVLKYAMQRKPAALGVPGQ